MTIIRPLRHCHISDDFRISKIALTADPSHSKIDQNSSDPKTKVPDGKCCGEFVTHLLPNIVVSDSDYEFVCYVFWQLWIIAAAAPWSYL